MQATLVRSRAFHFQAITANTVADTVYNRTIDNPWQSQCFLRRIPWV